MMILTMMIMIMISIILSGGTEWHAVRNVAYRMARRAVSSMRATRRRAGELAPWYIHIYIYIYNHKYVIYIYIYTYIYIYIYICRRRLLYTVRNAQPHSKRGVRPANQLNVTFRSLKVFCFPRIPLVFRTHLARNA